MHKRILCTAVIITALIGCTWFYSVAENKHSAGATELTNPQPAVSPASTKEEAQAPTIQVPHPRDSHEAFMAWVKTDFLPFAGMVPVISDADAAAFKLTRDEQRRLILLNYDTWLMLLSEFARQGTWARVDDATAVLHAHLSDATSAGLKARYLAELQAILGKQRAHELFEDSGFGYVKSSFFNFGEMPANATVSRVNATSTRLTIVSSLRREASLPDTISVQQTFRNDLLATVLPQYAAPSR